MTTQAPAGTRYSISVLTTHTVDSAPALLVAFDSQRYLFNTPEAISRIALQNKVGLRKVGHVFLGDLEESAGLPGFILSSVEAGNDRIKVVGPEGSDHFLATCRFFTRRDKLSLQTIVQPSSSNTDGAKLPEPIHADQNLVVYAFPLEATASEGPIEKDSAAAEMPASAPTRTPSSPSRKRRRSSSATPPPRAKSPPGETSASFYPSSASFNPARLVGAEAAHWRSLVLRDMFRGTLFEPAPPPQPPASPSGRRIASPAYLPQPLPPFERRAAEQALSYLVVGPRLRGKFLPEKARAAGVKPGKAFARLVAGERVWVRAQPQVPEARPAAAASATGADGKKETKKERKAREKREAGAQAKDEGVEGEGEGRWVEPEEYMSAGQDGSAFLVINVPTTRHLASLPGTLRPERFTSESLGSHAILRGAFFFVGAGVLDSPGFRSYLEDLRAVFSELAIHLSSSDLVQRGKNEITFGPSSLLNLRLRQLDEKMFQLPRYSFRDPSSAPPLDLPAGSSTLSPNSHFSSSLVPLEADKVPFGSGVRTFDFAVPSAQADVEAARLKGPEKPAEVQQRAAEAWAAFVDKAKAAREAVAQEEADRPAGGDASAPPSEGAVTVTPLGTGSAIPSKYRNVSGTLLHLPREREDDPKQYILLDAGEGTWGQLARRFGNGEDGEESVQDVLGSLKMIFLSHMHQDHHAGIATILRKRAQLANPPSDPLYIVAPPNARTYLSEQHQLFDLGLDFNRDEPGRDVLFLDNYLVEPGKSLSPGSRAAKSLSDLMATTGLVEVTAVPVLHRCRAWGAVLTHRSGWRVAFSGDTMPCDALVEAGQGASLLVHEATIEDDMPEVARAKGHSTFGQAIDVATRMKARHLLLTHFSARYPKLPPLSTFESSEHAHRPVVATAFDLMTLRLDEFWKVERYRDAMDALLSWDEADDRDDTDELSKKEQRLSAANGDAEAPQKS